MAEEEKQQETINNTVVEEETQPDVTSIDEGNELLSEQITDTQRAEETSVNIDLDEILNKSFDFGTENRMNNLYDVQYFFDKMGNARDRIDDYELETGNKVVDYLDENERIIKNTGTGLDGKTIDEVAVSKQASPKQMWETKDVLEQWSYGVYDFCRNSTNTVANGVLYLLTGETASPEELQRSNIADFGEPPEARSVAGSIAKPIAQYSSGAVTLSGLGAMTGASKAVSTASSAAKTKFGAVAIKGTAELMKGMANEALSFSENNQNFSELMKQLGVNISADLLVKNPEDSFFMKKLKNSMDGGLANLVFNTLVGSAKIFGKGVAKPVQIYKDATKSTDITLLPYNQMKQLLKNKEVKDSVYKALTNKNTVLAATKNFGDAADVIKDEVKNIITPDMLDDATKTVKGLSKAEKEKIYRNVMSELSDDTSIAAADRISKAELKNINKKQFEEAVYYKQKEILESQKISEEANIFLDEIAKANVNEKEITNFALDKFQKLIENRKATIESVSGAAQSVAEISTSNVARRMNKLIDYIKDNADKIDSRKLIDMIGALQKPEDFDMFFGIANNALEHGAIEQFFDKITYVRQNIMLASGVTQLKDISSTLGHRVLEWGDTATATGIKNLVVKPYRKLRKVFTKGDQTSAKIRLGMGDVDDVELMEIWDNIVGMGEFLGDEAKFKFNQMTKRLLPGEISPIERHMNQVGASASKYNFKKNITMDVIPGNNVFSKTANSVINHSGIYISEAKDDVIQAMFHQADIRTNVGSLVRRALRSGEITKDQVDDFIRGYLKSSESWAGSNSNALIDFANGLTDSARLDSIMKRAGASSGISTFRSPLTGATKDIYDAVNKHAITRIPLRIIAPFQKTGMVVAIERGLKERSVFALLNPQFRSAIKRGGRDGQMATARLLNGLAIQGAVAWQMYKGNIIGPMPKNKGERELLKSVGATEYSVKVGDKYYSLTDVAGPAGPLIRQSLDVTDAIIRGAIDADENPDKENLYLDTVLATASTFALSPFTTTMYGGILENAERGDPLSLKNVITSFATGPRIINEAQSAFSRLADFVGVETDLGRDTRYRKAPYDLVDRAKTSIGFEGHYARDLFGNKMEAPYMSFIGLNSSDAVNDPVVEEMIYRKAYVNPPSNTLEYKQASIPLSDEEKDLWFQEMKNINAYERMEDFINSREYKQLPESEFSDGGLHLKNKKSELVDKYNELKKEAAKKLIDNNIELQIKYDKAISIGKEPTINVNPYMRQFK